MVIQLKLVRQQKYQLKSKTQKLTYTHVKNNELPLFLRNGAMKKTDTTIDFTKDNINILGQEMNMKFTLKEHYLIPISKSCEELNEFDENNTKSILLSFENVSNGTLRKKTKCSRKITQAVWACQLE